MNLCPLPETLPMLEKRTGYHNYEHIFEWLRAGVVTYQDYASSIQPRLRRLRGCTAHTSETAGVYSPHFGD